MEIITSRTSLLDLEEMPSVFTYPPEYQGPRPIAKQIEVVAEIFNLSPDAANAYATNLPALPEEAEGWFAVPKSVTLAIVLEKLAARGAFYVESTLLESARSRAAIAATGALRRIAETQEGDILIIAAQLGFWHRGRKVRYARARFTEREFGLSVVAVGAIALVHPERFVRLDELGADCPGDETKSFSGEFDNTPYFKFHQEWQNGVLTKSQLELRSRWIGSAHVRCGAATGFVP